MELQKGNRMVSLALCHAYRSYKQWLKSSIGFIYNSCLWEHDFDYRGFEWVNFSDVQNSVISYLRKGSEGRFFCVHNFTPAYYPNYFLHLQGISNVEEIFNSDAEKYGGSGKLNNAPRISAIHLEKPLHFLPTITISNHDFPTDMKPDITYQAYEKLCEEIWNHNRRYYSDNNPIISDEELLTAYCLSLMRLNNYILSGFRQHLPLSG